MSSHMELPAATEEIPLTDRLADLAAFMAGLLLLRLPFALMVRIIAWVKRRCH